MYVGCIRESVWSDSATLTALEKAAKNWGVDAIWLVYGSSSTFDEAKDLLDLDSGSVVYVGPDSADLEPVEWFGFIAALEGGFAEQARIAVFQKGGVMEHVAETVEEGLCWFLSWTTSELSLVSVAGWIGRRELAPSMDILESVPKVLTVRARWCFRLIECLIALARKAYLDPNSSEWDVCKERKNASAVDILRIADELKKLENIFRFGISEHLVQQTNKVSGVRVLEKMTHPVTFPRTDWEFSAVSSRLCDWSAFFFVQARVFRGLGCCGVALLAYWRALEKYQEKVAFDEGIIGLSEGGAWEWRVKAACPGEVSAFALERTLRERGMIIEDPALKRKGRTLGDVRKIRNNSMLVHGNLGVDLDVLSSVEDLVENAIARIEGASSRWRANVLAMEALWGNAGSLLIDCLCRGAPWSDEDRQKIR